MNTLYQKFKAGGRLSLLILLILSLSACETVHKSYNQTKEWLSSKTAQIGFSGGPFSEKEDPEISKARRDIQFAYQQYNLKKYGVAEYYIKKSLIALPEDISALKLLPWTYFFQERFDKALLGFKRWHSLNRKNPEPIIGMGWCYFSMKQYEQSLEKFDDAERLSGNPFQVHKGKGFTYLGLQRYPKARQELKKIFTAEKTEQAMLVWEQWKERSPENLVEIVSSSPESPSLFTFPVEHPRYQSALMGLPQRHDWQLESGWDYYNRQIYKKALETFSELEDNKEDSPDLLNGLGWSYLKNRQTHEAEKIFKNILRKYPHFIGALKGSSEVNRIKMQQAAYAQYYLDREKWSIAEKKLSQLLSEYPEWAHPKAQMGHLELMRNNHEKARKFFQEAMRLDSESELASKGMDQLQKINEKSLYLANQSMKQGDYKTAARLYSEFIENQGPAPKMTASLAEAYKGLGWSQYQKRYYDLAAQKFRRAREYKEFEFEAAKGEGLALYNSGNYSQAANILKIAYNENPDDQEVSYNLDRSILKGWEPEQAANYFEESLKQHPLRASLYMGLGWIHYNRNNPDLAVEYFIKAISLDPDFAMTNEFQKMLRSERFGWQVYNQLGWVYYEKKDYKNSANMFRIALRRQPNKSEARKGLGYTLYRMKKYRDAAAFLRQCLALNNDPNPVIETVTGPDAIAPFELETTARTRLARILILLNNPREALVLYNEELQIRPGQPDAYDGLGWAYLKLNRLTESRTAFKKAIERMPLNNQSHRGLKEVKQRLAEIKMKNTSPVNVSESGTNSPTSLAISN